MDLTSPLAAVVTAAASVASLVALVLALRPERRRVLALALLAILLAVSTGWLAFQDWSLRDVENEARVLAATWPRDAGIASTDNRGQYVGILLGGVAFFEKHRDRFPESYARAVDLTLGARATQSDADTRALYDASGAMIVLVNTIARNPVTIPTHGL
jgi:hypothetical protein